MLKKIIGFELQYRFAKPMTYIFILMMIFQAIWYAKGSYDFYINDATNFNAAAIIYRSLAGGGMLMIIAIAVITGTALFKDIEYKTAETLYSYPVSDRTWVAGKFIAAYIVNLSICLAYALGFTLIQYTGIAEPDKFGPVPWGHIFYGFLIFSVPNMFIITTITLSLVVFFRNMASSYLGVFIVTMLFILAESTRENAANITAVYLIDPFCYTHTVDTIDALPVAAKNYGYFHLDAIYWANRAIWLGIAIVLTLFAFRKFSFKYFIEKPAAKNKILNDNEEISFSETIRLTGNKIFTISGNIKKLFRLSILEFKNIVRPVGFKIIFGILALMFFMYNYLWNAEYYIHTDTLPLTSAMTFTRLPNGVFMLILLAVFAGELLFKERSAHIWQITDTLPVPTWVTYFSKYLAMSGVALLFALLLFIPGIIVQSIRGFFDYEWAVYLNDLFSYHFGWLNYLLVIALAFFMGAVTANRFAAHIITVAILFFIIIFEDIGVIEQVRFTFPFVPGNSEYSEMNGYGTMGDAAIPYMVMWTVLGGAFLLAGLWFWNRGSIQPLAKRFALKKTQLHLIGKTGVLALLAAFFYMQHYVVANDHELGNFRTKDQQDAEDAEYEKRFRYIESKNQPLVCGMDVTIEIIPDIRKASYKFHMLLVNRGNTAIDTLYISLKDFVKLHSLRLDPAKLSPAWESKEHGQLAYHLPVPIQSGDTVSLDGDCTLQYAGFSSADPQRALVYNGSFLEKDIVPYIGYNKNKEIDRNRIRSSYGLAKLPSRMEPVDDTVAVGKEALSPNALRHKTTIRVRAAGGQTAFASGAYKGTETIQGKEYAVYETESPAAMNWYIGAAKYGTYRADVNSNITLKILYDLRHAYNLQYMKDAVDKGVTFLQEHLGQYPFSQLCISEIPFYNDEDFYTAPNAIAISEKHCWTADGSRDKDLSYIYYAICRELFAQWIQQNIHVADVQGADMLLKAVPEAYALSFIQEKSGKETLDIYIEKKKERYGKGRGIESNTEPPLVYADGADYLEANKGALELLNVMQEMGTGRFSALFTSWASANTGKNVVFTDFYKLLSGTYPADKKAELTAAFEKVEQ